MLVKMTQGVNFINFLHKAFTRADPKSAKKTYSLTVPLCFGDLHVYYFSSEDRSRICH